MFKKKNCPKCNEKINDKYSFCPNCGFNLKNNKSKDDEKNYGMLGKNDSFNQSEQNPEFQNLFGGFGGKIMNNMLNSAMKMLEKEMQKSLKEQNMNNNPNNNFNKTNFELYIHGKRISPDKIKVTRAPNNPNFKNKNLLTKDQINNIGYSGPKNPSFSKEAKENFVKLPKKQPTTNIRRLSNKIVYEIDIPGVKSIKDISIAQMENSIEVRAISKENAYEKIIPIGLPISRYGFSEGKLILELKETQ